MKVLYVVVCVDSHSAFCTALPGHNRSVYATMAFRLYSDCNGHTNTFVQRLHKATNEKCQQPVKKTVTS